MNQLFQKTTHEIVAQLSKDNFTPEHVTEALQHASKLYTLHTHAPVFGYGKSSIYPILSFPEVEAPKSVKPPSYFGLELRMTRIAPPMLPLQAMWLRDDAKPKPMLAKTNELDFETCEQFKQLMQKALHTALNSNEEKQMLALLKQNADVLRFSGLTADLLSYLVNTNPNVSYDCVVGLLSSSQAGEYLQAIAQMDISLNAMELVAKLTSSNLPAEFLHQFISNSIQVCYETKDMNVSCSCLVRGSEIGVFSRRRFETFAWCAFSSSR